MGKPLAHTPVKLIVGLISGIPAQFTRARRILEKKFGCVDRESDLLEFSCTQYYEEELGGNLKRKFLSFKRLADLRKNYEIKLYTNAIEQKLSAHNRRIVNIDPGYISLTKLLLFTTKNRSHRIYIDKGIYGDIELIFAQKTFKPLEWTYPDYKSEEYINFFNAVRDIYVSQIKNTPGVAVSTMKRPKCFACIPRVHYEKKSPF